MKTQLLTLETKLFPGDLITDVIIFSEEESIIPRMITIIERGIGALYADGDFLIRDAQLLDSLAMLTERHVTRL